MENEKLMAVWKYDIPPYYRCAEVERIAPDGKVVPVGYDGYCFDPIKIMPYSLDKINNYKKLEQMYHKEERELSNRYRSIAEMILDVEVV